VQLNPPAWQYVGPCEAVCLEEPGADAHQQENQTIS
jgi:hypothetical protein